MGQLAEFLPLQPGPDGKPFLALLFTRNCHLSGHLVNESELTN